MHKLTTDAVTALMLTSLYSKEEHLAAGFTIDEAPKDAVRVDGIVSDFGFHPRVKDTESAILEMLAEVPLEFFPESEGGGGGMSFLRLCMRRDGTQWGEHRDCQSLYVLAAATGHAAFLMGREYWRHMPGGLPYIVFSTARLPVTLEA